MAIKTTIADKVIKLKGGKDIAFPYVSAPDLTRKQADKLLEDGTIEGRLELIAHNQLVMTTYIADILNLMDKK